MDIKLTLVPHVGTRKDSLVGAFEVEFDQFIINATSESLTKATGRKKLELGYVGKKPGAPINWLPTANRFSPAVRTAMATEIQKQLAALNPVDQAALDAGQTRRESAPPPDVVVKPSATGSDDGDTAGTDENL